MSIASKISYFIILAGTFTLSMFAAVNLQNVSVGFYLVAASILTFLLLFGFAAGYYLSRPLQAIGKTIDQLVKGNLESRVDIQSDDEFALFASSINKIGTMLQEARDQKEMVHRTVGVKVNSLVQPVYETIEALEEKVAHRTTAMHQAMGLSEKLQTDLAMTQAQLASLKTKIAKAKKRKTKRMVS